jgi:hypothetical protein
MMRLLEKGLVFAELFEVNTPAMVARYNEALKKLTGKTTELTEFMVDLSGFAPEIADEFNDQYYLNPHGVNRQFILLSTAQKNCPLLNTKFSTSRDVLRQFIEDNESQLFALTARDAVAGELSNSVYRADTPARLFDIRKIIVEADTTSSHLRDAVKLHKKIDRFMTEEDAWWDDVLISDMINLSKRTGDVTQNPIMFKQIEYEQANFFTEHFGGIYIFRDTRVPAAICRQPKEKVGKIPSRNVLDFDDRASILRFLDENNLVESIINARGLDAAALLNQRLDFILIDAAADAGEDVSALTRTDLKKLHRKHLPDLPEEYHVLSKVLRWVTQGGRKPRIDANNPAAFYTLRAAPGPDRTLVNMMLAELCPHDIRQLYIVHKQAFLDAYQTWPESKRAYVAEYLAREYVMDKVGAREALFGHEEPMVKELKGPWGSYQR